MAAAALGACSHAKSKDKRIDAGAAAAVTDGGISSTLVEAPTAPAVDAVAAFTKTVQPLLRQWCVSCHSTVQSPLFAAADAASAYHALIDTQKVDFQAVAQSRLVLRLSADRHNCPVDPGCDEAAKEMQGTLQALADAIKTTLLTTLGQVRSAGLHLADATTQTVLGDNPDGVLAYFAPNFTPSAPLALAPDAVSGNPVLNTAASAGSNTDAAAAAVDAKLGTATVTAKVTKDGTYKVIGLVNGPTATSASFYLKIDDGALNPWLFATNAAAYTWETAAASVGGPALTFDLKAGDHKIELRQREAGAQLARLVLSAVDKFDPAVAQATSRQAKQIRFDLAAASKIPGVAVTLEVEDYAANAYLFRNPSLVVTGGIVHAKDLRVSINGVFLLQNATFTVVDATLPAPGGSLSSAAMIAVKDQGPDKDVFAVSLQVLEPK